MALVRATERERDGALYLTAAFTGLRLGELLALRWGDVDFDSDAIRVERSYTAGREGTPKSGRGRAVPMMEEVAQALAQLASVSGSPATSSSSSATSSAGTWSTSPSATATNERSTGPS